MAIVRCSEGALFETKWVPFVSFKAARLGTRRVQRCPVHRKWQLIERVDPATLSDEQLADAARHPAGWLP